MNDYRFIFGVDTYVAVDTVRGNVVLLYIDDESHLSLRHKAGVDPTELFSSRAGHMLDHLSNFGTKGRTSEMNINLKEDTEPHLGHVFRSITIKVFFTEVKNE